jgi:hypothetical protein
MKPKTRFIKKLWNWRQRVAYGLGYTRTKKESVDTSEQTSPKDFQSTDLLLLTCSTLKYSDFLKYLLEEEIPPENWIELQAEFSELLRTPKTENITQLWKKIVYTDWKVKMLSASVAYLKVEYSGEIAEALMLLGYDLVEDLEDRELYLRQIYMVESESKTLVIMLNQYTNEYKLMFPEGEYKRTRADYEKELAILGKYMGYRLNEITVSEFAGIVNLYMDQQKKDA